MSLDIRPLAEADLAEADRICRLAFGTFLGLPDPMAFLGDADLVRSRWRADPEAALGAYLDDRLVGSNFAARWGAFGFFGPLTVRPDLWDQGVARALLRETVKLFDSWGVRQAGLFTFPHSVKHVGLYQRFGFWPRSLTPVLARDIAPGAADPAPDAVHFSQAPDRSAALSACREIAESVFSGLDLSREIRAAADQGLGETLILAQGGVAQGFAICHAGAGSEAGSGAAYVKFAAVRPGAEAAAAFEALVRACEAFAAQRGAARLSAGVNSARLPAYQSMLARGYRATIQGVAMLRAGDSFNRPDCFVLDDWR